MNIQETEPKGSNRDVRLFFGLTFLITWGVWIPLVLLRADTPLMKLGTFGPTLAALLLIGTREGKPGLIRIGRQLIRWRVSWIWYAAALVGPVLMMTAAVFLFRLFGGTGLVFQDLSQWYLIPVIFGYVLFTSVLGEEIGWRGYALPGLMKNLNPLPASLILGAVWGIWHLPLFWLAGDFHQDIPLVLFLVQVTAASVIYTWMYLRTRGSLLIIHLFHAATNTAAGLLPVLPFNAGGSLAPFAVSVGLLTAGAGLVVLLGGLEPDDAGQSRKLGNSWL
jgi:hypothetical protein